MADLSMLPDFIDEAVEHLEELESSLLRLETHREDADVLNDIFRAMHTIKGAAQFVGIERISELSHKLENLLDTIRQGEQQLDEECIDLLIDGKDRISQLVTELETSQAEETEISDLILRIDNGEKPSDDTITEPEVPTVIAHQSYSLDADIQEEEHDEELYNIFLEQLQEKIPFLQSQIDTLATTRAKQDILAHCTKAIKNLLSSANYMGYEKLNQHYREWQGKIEESLTQFSAELQPDLSFMQSFLDEIISVYPQTMENSTDSTEDGITDALDSLFSDTPEATLRTSSADASADLESALNSAFIDNFGDNTEEETESSTPAELVNEAMEEEYDEELLDIFMTQLQEKVPFLQSQVLEIATTANKEEVLNRCSDTIASLQSSANYMGYDKLINHYVQWLNALGQARDRLRSGQQLDFCFMQLFIDEINNAYPPRSGDIEQTVDDTDDLDAALDSVLSDAFSGSLGDTAEKSTPDSEVLENEALAEEHDEELLNIFINQLQESIPLLQSQITEIPGSTDKQSLLSHCNETIKRLYSSANYMGYEKLTKHYSTWQNEILAAETKVQTGEEPDFAFMQKRIDEIIAAYPRAMEATVQATVPDPDDEFEDITETIGSMLSVPPPKVPDKEAPIKKRSEDITVMPEQQDTEDDEELFSKLSNALEASLNQEENIPLTPMHGVIEEMVTPKKAEPKPSSPKSAGTPEPEKTKPQQEAQPAEKKAPAKIKQSMRVDTDKIDFLMNQVGELVVSRAYFAQLFAEMRGLQQHLSENFNLTKSELKPVNEFAFRLGEAGVALGRVSNELQEGVMKVRMLPIDHLFKRFPRLIRDLVHKSDKKVNLKTRGEETELDKMVVEEISDPLIHILRNAVDHGIESAEERIRQGKPETGTITLEAYHESDHIVIDVTDDGKGLDIKRIKDKALAKGLYSESELNRMTESEVKHLIMQPGFSTAEKTTKTSGRGVGMDVVKKNIEKLNGSIEIETTSGKGSRIRIKIPLTMAIIQALMVRVGEEKFTIPLTSVEETLRIFQQDVSEIEGVDVIHIRDTTMPIFRLAKMFSIQDANQDRDKLFVVVVSTGSSEIGLVVDELLGQEEVVIKPLADYLRTDSGFSGATILGTGGISLILDIPELVEMSNATQVRRQQKLSYGRRVVGHDDMGQRVVH